MAAAAEPPAAAGLLARWRRWRNDRVSDPRFQAWAARFLLTRAVTRREGEEMFDLLSGFVYSQALMALVELGTLRALRGGDMEAAALAARAGVPAARMEALLRAGVALGLMEMRGGVFGLSRKGAALLGAPGLEDMIRHHRVLYRDLEDPAAFLRGETETELAGFWPYVFGAAAAEEPEAASRYSDLMAKSQIMVADETLAAISFADARLLMDVGGGTGAFLEAAGRAHPGLKLRLFDLPAVAPAAAARFRAAGMEGRAEIVSGSFREGPLPEGADAISLVRVLYDHQDETVLALLRATHQALPPGGRIVVSEPMTGGAAPNRSGDVYFAFYCMAMRTGRARSQAEIAALLAAAGFGDVRTPRPRRAFVTALVAARKPD